MPLFVPLIPTLPLTAFHSKLTGSVCALLSVAVTVTVSPGAQEVLSAVSVTTPSTATPLCASSVYHVVAGSARNP